MKHFKPLDPKMGNLSFLKAPSLRRNANGCHSTKKIHLTRETLLKKNWTSNTCFKPEGPLFCRCYNQSIEENFKRKKSGCSLSKNGYLTPILPPKYHFAYKCLNKDFLLTRFYQRKRCGVSKPPSVSSFYCDLEENPIFEF